MIRCVHYVGFRGDEFVRAKRIWGGPAFIHRRWDRRSQREIGEEDVVIFAEGYEAQPFVKNGDDIDERYLSQIERNL